jgi:acyl-homoserine-lactone acylase
MHTSSGADVVDEFQETIVRKEGQLFYRYGGEERPLQVRPLEVPYRTSAGGRAVRHFTVYRTHHGPIVRATADGAWVSVALMFRPVEALSQAFLRTKARDHRAFLEACALQANSSNNTILADADGDIAYLHPQFIPRRDDRFDYTRPVDGSDPATDWRGLHAAAEVPHLLNPATGWLFNTNDWPYSAAGPDSPRREAFPRYMDSAGPNARGAHAALVLQGRKDFTLESLAAAAFDPYLPAFAQLVPLLVAAHDQAPAADPARLGVAEQVAVLRAWDFRWAVDSIPTTLAVHWGEALWEQVQGEAERGRLPLDALVRTSPEQKLAALASASALLVQDFGTWRTPWGEVNRFQRLTGEVASRFDDAAPSAPVGFTSAQWGSLAAFGARPQAGTRRRYGTKGNSFVAVVEFGERVRALAVTAGGVNGDPSSPHFRDQIDRYRTGDLREVYFHPEQLKGHTERTYHPGD